MNIVPAPAAISSAGEPFELTATTTICAGGLEPLLREYISPATGFELPTASPGDDQIRIRVDPSLHSSHEAYRLEVRAHTIEIVGAGDAGAFYGIQTLRQLLPSAIYGGKTAPGVSWHVPAVVIDDVPRFPWRGALLDVARHFFTPSFVRRFVDLLAMHKLNTLHLHLTDDQGWRLEIPEFPRLTEVGAWRAGSMVGHLDDAIDRDAHDGIRHGGFYTQEEIRSLVEYARQRHVTVVPEVELLGHAQAAIAAYPWLGSTGRQLPVATGWGISPHVLEPSPRTLDFARAVLANVFELFPSTYVHLGGDECPTGEWQASRNVQARIRELGLRDEAELQDWFLAKLNGFAAANGRTMVGWDELVSGVLPPECVVMSWRDEAGGVEAVRRGHRVVMTPQSHTYFDHYQSAERNSEPLAIGGLVDLPGVYGYEPVPSQLTGGDRELVLGSQFQLWTEYIRTPQELEYMAFPRGCAFAEVVWSERRDSDHFFAHRLPAHLQRLRQLGVNYRSA